MTYDVIVIGGGPAGLSGAVALGRALRSVLVVDAGEPRNAPADGIHNFLTRDGVTPAEFAELGRAEVRRYGGEVTDGRVVAATGSAGDFTVRLADGSEHRARRLLITTGLIDRLPDVPGVREHWGGKVVHCPYCHGYEIRGTAVGILAAGPMAVHAAVLWGQWTTDVTLFLNDALEPDAEQTRQLAARAVTVVRGRVTALDDTGVTLADGRTVARDHLVVQSHLEARAELVDGLGLKAIEHPMGIGTYLAAEDPTGRTAVPGVWVAGNVTDPMGQVVTSAGAGLMAGAAINMDLITEQLQAPASSR